MSRKGLTPEDLAIWQKVTKTVTPYPDRPRPNLEPPKKRLMSLHRPRPVMDVSALPHPQSNAPLVADKAVKRGRVIIDRKLDLHGLTYDAALMRLREAILRVSQNGGRCLLVVTGKGKAGEGVLRRALPDWLSRPDIRPLVARYAPAHIRHGGGGAFYVFLKRRGG